MLVSEACSRFLFICKNNKNLSSLTIKAYSIDLAQFQAGLGKNTEIEKVTKTDLMNFQVTLAEAELSQSSIKRKLACVRAMFRFLELEEIIDLNPFHKLHLGIKLPRRLPRNVPTDQLIKLTKHARASMQVTGHSYCVQSFVDTVTNPKALNKLTTLLSLELMLCTGIRVSELIGIQLSHIHLKNRKIKIYGKGARERFVYLPDQELCNLIKAYIHCRNLVSPLTDVLIINSRGMAGSTQFVRKLIKQLSEKSPLSNKVTPHMLRHSAACELLDTGLDIRFVQRLLGHSSISTTEIYTHVSDKSLKEKITRANVRKRVIKM